MGKKEKEEGKKKGKKKWVVLAVLLVLAMIGSVTGEGTDAPTETTEVATVDELTAMRDDVLEIQEYDVAAGTYQPVLDAINQAQQVIEWTDAPTDEQITSAYNALVDAKNGVVLIEDAEKTVENASVMARKYTAGSSSYSREMTVYNLVNVKGYDQATAEAGVDASGIDWNEEAFQYVMGQISIHDDITIAELTKDMTTYGYTAENIGYALVQAGIAS